MTGLTWDDLAAIALLGTRRRPVPGDGGWPPALGAAVEQVARAREARRAAGSEPDAAEALLDAAALATVYRRAGVRGRPARPLPAPAPADPRRVARPAAAVRLAALLRGADRELLELWLATAARVGARPPDQLLPALLDHAVRVPTLAPAVAEVAGERGRWLARHRRDWDAALEGSPSAPTARSGDGGGWELGTPAGRVAWLAERRAVEPGAARRVLEGSWPQEEAVHRAALLAALETGLGPDDEPFLERCLADRRADVRATAASLLTALPGSALAARAAARALAAVRAERQVLRRRLVVTPPEAHDAAMARDQVPAPPVRAGTGRGTGTVPPGTPAGVTGASAAWLVLHVVAAAPLACWEPALGGTPDVLAALDVADGWRPAVWSGWARAAIRERDARWAAALLDQVPPSPGTAGRAPAGAPARAPAALPGAEPADPVGTVGALLGLLPEAPRAGRVAGWLRSREGPPAPAPVLLRAVPAPWPEPVAGAVLHWLCQRPRLDDQEGRAVVELAARRLPGGAVGALRDVAERWPPGSPTRRSVAAAAELMSVRRTLVEELQ